MTANKTLFPILSSLKPSVHLLGLYAAADLRAEAGYTLDICIKTI